MDLLGDIGAADQLTSVRAENAVLNKKVKELSLKVKELTVENQALLAEVEIYRKEASSLSSTIIKKGEEKDDAAIVNDTTPDEFVKSGNGVYPTDPVISFEKIHQNSNPLCCALHPDDTLLATGGADFNLSICQWGGALAPVENADSNTVEKAIRLRCPAPVISLAFSQQSSGEKIEMVAAGCMDGSVVLVTFRRKLSGLSAKFAKMSSSIKFTKYIKGLSWSPVAPLLAVASADGMVIVYKVSKTSVESEEVEVTVSEKLHLSGTTETICFSGDGKFLVCYVRDTPYLSYFNLEENFKHTKLNLNKVGGAAVGGFGDHVSFAVMDMSVSPNGKFLALATDKSRNIVIDFATGKQIRNLYGHTNDGFSNPKIAWSNNGQYIYGNTQEDGSICIWDIASAKIVKRLEGHKNPVRAMYSSRLTDTLVTASFDKHVKIWMTPM